MVRHFTVAPAQGFARGSCDRNLQLLPDATSGPPPRPMGGRTTRRFRSGTSRISRSTAIGSASRRRNRAGSSVRRQTSWIASSSTSRRTRKRRGRRQPFDQFTRARDGSVRVHPRRVVAASRACFAVTQNRAERLHHPICAIPRLRNASTEPEVFDAPGIVELVICPGRQDCG